MKATRTLVTAASHRPLLRMAGVASLMVTACVGYIGPVPGANGTGGVTSGEAGSGGVNDPFGVGGEGAGGTGMGTPAPVIPSDIKLSGGAADAVAPAPTPRLSNME